MHKSVKKSRQGEGVEKILTFLHMSLIDGRNVPRNPDMQHSGIINMEDSLLLNILAISCVGGVPWGSGKQRHLEWRKEVTGVSG